MATDESGLGNGIIITAVKNGFGHVNNSAPDMTSHVSVQCTYSNSPIDVEPERFKKKATDTSSVTFSQLNSEASETWNVVIEYEISTTG